MRSLRVPLLVTVAVLAAACGGEPDGSEPADEPAGFQPTQVETSAVDEGALDPRWQPQVDPAL